jgi:methylated-DNA-[protein]-cysteine S-methyltransferase
VFRIISSPLGDLELEASQGRLRALRFLRYDLFSMPSTEDTQGQGCPTDVEVLDVAQSQLDQWFNHKRRSFDLPLLPQGTPFMEAVWKALQDIPYGETRTYSEIALVVGKPRAVRAVGLANHRNPLPIIIPCHRVVGKNGSLTGYAGGLDIKQKLLTLEADRLF